MDFFASDVHIRAERPEVTHRFLRFLSKVRDEGDRLFLLGDIFDAWVGAKQARVSYVRPVLEALRSLHASGVEVHYVAGNRDFTFDARLNGHPVPTPPEFLSVEAEGRRLLLTHGDMLCTGDRAYRRARRIGRSQIVRRVLGSLPFRFAAFLARGYSRLSARAVAAKPRIEKALDFGRVRRALLDGHDVVICGHVHRAARYRVSLPEGRRGEFITLGDWMGSGSYLVAREGRLDLRKFP